MEYQLSGSWGMRNERGDALESFLFLSFWFLDAQRNPGFGILDNFFDQSLSRVKWEEYDTENNT